MTESAAPCIDPALFGTMVDLSPDLFFFKDADLIYRYVNKAFCALFDVAPQAVLDHTDFDIFSAPNAKRHRLADQTVLATSRSQTFEYEVERKDRSVWLQVLKTPVLDGRGQVAGVFCVARNITSAKAGAANQRDALAMLEQDAADRAEELRRANQKLRHEVDERRKAEEALQDSHRSLNAIFENSPIGISFVADRVVRRANPHFHQLFALPQGTAIGLSTSAMYPSQESFEDFGRRYYPVLGRGGRVDAITRMRRHDGTDFMCRMIGQVIDADRPQAGSIWLLEDVTDRLLAQEATLAAERLKREFMDNMSHEIRTPLNGILGMTELLKSTELDAQQQEYLETLVEAGRNLETLLESVLEFARLDSGDVETHLEMFSVSNLIQGSVAFFGTAALQKGLSLVCNVAETVPDLLLGDGGGLRQILAALLSNAVKFTQAGAIEVSATVAPGSPPESSAPGGPEAVVLTLTVRDTGIGLSPGELETIFKPFRQADGSKTRRFGGVGLGLAIAGKLAKAMGGSLTVESLPGQGSVFRYSAPFKLPPADDDTA
ncbi:PAS domain-containing protein [Desulfovibrio aerotolerans]|uniref:histidine kinase n=2 Tax=Solidesulfovibrio aerotolerans TaxID=295255 RepID=A0A7C9NL17_9BACT|nr:PAS domain-containing protein [Solidesulfovibrio aerotolerans]MYL84436.1 PAS domain-containing protein [Solidesulfovibrio aerotolerans]